MKNMNLQELLHTLRSSSLKELIYYQQNSFVEHYQLANVPQ